MVNDNPDNSVPPNFQVYPESLSALVLSVSLFPFRRYLSGIVHYIYVSKYSVISGMFRS